MYDTCTTDYCFQNSPPGYHDIFKFTLNIFVVPEGHKCVMILYKGRER